MDPSLPTVELTLWRDDAIVLVDWLMSVDLNTVPVSHPAQKQALADLLARFEQDTDVVAVNRAEIDRSQSEVARDMGW